MHLKFRILAVCSLICGVTVAAAPAWDRETVALPLPGNQAYVGWRLLAQDVPDQGFDVFRSARAGGAGQKINAQPVTGSCNLVDLDTGGQRWFYAVKPAGRGKASAPAQLAETNFLRLKLAGNYLVNKAALADLDGDGILDYVVKQPEQATDPGVWRKSPDTFKVEAYRRDGTLLWRKDLGWNIEQGIWYSPMIVCDLDGDGKAEVVVKTAPTDRDYRNDSGRVLDGPEYVSVLDGMTGQERARVDWIPRGKIEDWGDNKGNRASRHMLGVAYLDGQKPSLLVHRGTYTTMRCDAYDFANGKLTLRWSWNGDRENPPVRGQGLHGIQAADIDADGKDEVILGSAALDDDGRLLWSTGLGHADACYVADIDPDRPGLEIMYGIEPKQPSNGVCLVEARTGKIIWGFQQPTTHVHSQGMLADIDPANPGLEFYTGEKELADRWLFSARTGKVLSREDLGSLAPPSVYWADSPIKAYLRKDRLVLHDGTELGKVSGKVVAVGDFVGDWREELITTIPGEVRIYTTGVPATSRKVAWLSDRQYRTSAVMATSGYLYAPWPGAVLGKALKNQ